MQTESQLSPEHFTAQFALVLTPAKTSGSPVVSIIRSVRELCSPGARGWAAAAGGTDD